MFADFDIIFVGAAVFSAQFMGAHLDGSQFGIAGSEQDARHDFFLFFFHRVFKIIKDCDKKDK